MVICPRGLAVLTLAAALMACGSSVPSNDGGSTQNVAGGDSAMPIADSDNSDGDTTPEVPAADGDTPAEGTDGTAPETPAHICKQIYDTIINCCSAMAYKTQTAFMRECQADPFTSQQRDQFLEMKCEALTPLCSIGNACPQSTSCFQIGVGVGVCADNGHYPDGAAPCASSPDCGSGLACYGDGTSNYCVQTCIPTGGGFTVGQCPSGLACIRLSDGTHVCGDGDSVPGDAPQCTTRADCDSGWSCVVASSGAQTGHCLEQCIGN
jgi:hypothetical protein